MRRSNSIWASPSEPWKNVAMRKSAITRRTAICARHWQPPTVTGWPGGGIATTPGLACTSFTSPIQESNEPIISPRNTTTAALTRMKNEILSFDNTYQMARDLLLLAEKLNPQCLKTQRLLATTEKFFDDFVPAYRRISTVIAAYSVGTKNDTLFFSRQMRAWLACRLG